MIKSNASCVSIEHHARHERPYPENLTLETWAPRFDSVRVFIFLF